ncbi:MAG: glycosyltransferase family 4 protein [Candidatus Babeliales bacterium]|nr:glycosyltransferase family 4 protein [Candidatus Babeliales bacterium]
MKLNIKILFLLFNISVINANVDLDIVGFVDPYGGIGQVALSFIECLKTGLKIKLYNIYPEETRLQDLSKDTQKIVENSIAVNDETVLKNESNDVCLYTHILSTNKWDNFLNFKKNGISLAYSMVESTHVLQDWVDKLNSSFDALVVPDISLVKVYQDSGVKIPVFVLPMSLDLNKFKPKALEKNKKTFVFGNTAGFEARKNHILLIDAFHKVFGNNKNVILKLHGKGGGQYENIRKKISDLKSTNIILIKQPFTKKEYMDFIYSLDCYVTVSSGEGYSISPREALAANIPVIVSNNTAHVTLCNSGFVYPVKSDIAKEAYSEALGFVGKNFNCSLSDVCKALVSVYRNYPKFHKLAAKGSVWVKKYDIQNIKKDYFTLISPKKVVLGDINDITNDYVITNSQSLYNKYLKNIGKK